MRVLIATGLYPPQIGGPATYSKLLADLLPQKGVGVKVVRFGQVRHLPTIIRHIFYFFLVLKQGGGADVIYAQDPVSVGLPACLAAKILRKRFILKVVGDYAWEQGTQRFGIDESLDTFSKKYEEYSFSVRVFKKIQTYVARSSEKVIVPSEYLKKVVSNWGIEKEKIVVIYNSFEEVQVESNRETLRGLLRFEGALIVSAGRLVPWKGFFTLIEMMPEIVKKIPDAKLVIVGSGPDMEALEKKITDLNLRDRVSLAGVLEKRVLLRYLKAADVFVLNTFYEGFSHQLLEAMSVGVPIVTTNVGGNPEIIDNEKTGLLVEYNNKKELTEAILKLLKDTGLQKNIVTKAQKKVAEFGEERMIEKLVKELH